MEITGTIQAPDGSYDHLSVQGESYEEAKEALHARIPEGYKLVVIRTDQ